MRVNIVLASVLVIGLSLMIITQKVGAGDVLPRLSVVCEDLNGNLYSVGDDFAKRDECKKNGRLVELGMILTGTGSGNNGGPLQGIGDILFFNPTNSSLLRNDRTSWSVLYQENGPVWVQDDEKRNIPDTVNLTEMVAWDKSYFLLKSGDVYMFQFDKWVNIGHP